ncbi:beta-galactosidase GalB [Flectobacillus rivi]|uniref:Beta-galactosidase GalB n=1 Tax=Flectobacillus rivi TaxID=2984209 RepID=A0ABT6Z802_9BACT|nr:beta-galactosidase GalB [Flectobacillus rivi]MDI9877264.1 beta-galactosidase GalB [Flectobacillus rivi]
MTLKICWPRAVYGSVLLSLLSSISSFAQTSERYKINKGWRFERHETSHDDIRYDVRPEVTDRNDNIVADSKPTESVSVKSSNQTLKAWILPTANDFIKDPSKYYPKPTSEPVVTTPLVDKSYDDSHWQNVNLPHDWAIKMPFYKGENVPVGGGMGRLPVQGIGWYRKKLTFETKDAQKKIYLDIDGAMSYSMVWLNGKLVGGWPYGYNSYRLDLTPFIQFGQENQLAIRIDNPTNSARWYPGGGIYRNVWIAKVNPVHIAHWGTFVKTPSVSTQKANIDISLSLKNESAKNQSVDLVTELYLLDKNTQKLLKKVAALSKQNIVIEANQQAKIQQETVLANPVLWNPLPAQNQQLYLVKTKLFQQGKLIEIYDTKFGIRSVIFDANKGILVNGKSIKIQGVNQHHDLGALGAAFNVRAAERQLEMLRDLGCNAIRMSHNPPAEELLDLTDRMGFLVIDEVFDSWERKKTPLDFHLIFPEWHEPDTRSFIRRDKNHPSVIAWSVGNEVGEQYTEEAGAKIAQKLYDIAKDEDDTRPITASMNYAKPQMPFPKVFDIVSLNYQGEGIRDAPAYAHLKGIRTSPLYPAFQKQFPDKLILSSETASALSTRGTYVFPVAKENSAPVSEGVGGNGALQQVSGYELYTAAFGASPDKVFSSQDKHPFVAGEFVWTGWDYIGEPTPYYSARSSYSGIIDLAGFKKDRYYLYQARWRPELKFAHILPHWNWQERIGQITPVHVFTSADEAELFLNGKSLGRKKRVEFEYRFRWDDVIYEAGKLEVIAYKNGKEWARDIVQTTGEATQLVLKADRKSIKNNGEDLVFVELSVKDAKGNMVPTATQEVEFEVLGNGELVATDNGDPADLNSFILPTRKTYSGLALAIVKAKEGKKGTITIRAKCKGLKSSEIMIQSVEF